VLTLVLSLIYSNSFQGPFVFDDSFNIVNKVSMQMNHLSLRSIQRAAFEGANHRRWLPNLSFGINYYLGGHNVWGYHLVNLVIHIMTAMVLYGFCFTTLTLPKLDFCNRRAAEISLITAFLWAVHPVQTNAVTYIVQRMTSMASLFYLACLLLYIKGRLHKKPLQKYLLWVSSFICGLLALVSKENSAVLPLIILAYEFYFLKDRHRRILTRRNLLWLGMSLLSVVIIGWIYIGHVSLGWLLNGYAHRDFTLTERLLTESRIVFHYLTLLILPLPSRLNLAYDYDISHSLFAPPITLAATLGIILSVALTVYLFKNHRLLSFGLFWFLANLVIESTFIPLELIFEHRLYLPSTILILAVVAATYKLWDVRRTNLLRLLLTACLVTLCFFTWQRNEVWSSEIGVWRDVVLKSPDLARGYIQLGRAYVKNERFQEAFDLFESVADKKYEAPDFDTTGIYNHWGMAAFQLGKIDRAVELFEHVVQLDRTHWEGHYNLGLAYGSQGKMAEARREMALGMQLQQIKKAAIQ